MHYTDVVRTTDIRHGTVAARRTVTLVRFAFVRCAVVAGTRVPPTSLDTDNIADADISHRIVGLHPLFNRSRDVTSRLGPRCTRPAKIEILTTVTASFPIVERFDIQTRWLESADSCNQKYKKHWKEHSDTLYFIFLGRDNVRVHCRVHCIK